MHSALVVAAESGGYVYAVGAGHTIAAAGTAHFQVLVDFFPHFIDQTVFCRRKAADSGFVGGPTIFLNHFFRIHAGEDAGHLRLIPEPLEGPLRGGTLHGICRESLFCAVGQGVYQLAAPQRLHDDHGNAFVCGVMQSFPSRLCMLVQIIVLNLAEIPVISINQRFEGASISVEGKTDIADGAGLFLLSNPFLDADALQTCPHFYIKKHMHQVKIDVIRFQTFELFLKELFRGRCIF